jgi:selenocysteine lyase/cysteine desulfurase
MLGLSLPPESVGETCAALEAANVVVSVRGPSLRIAPHLHTSPDDMDRLINALTSTSTHQTSGIIEG